MIFYIGLINRHYAIFAFAMNGNGIRLGKPGNLGGGVEPGVSEV